MASTISVTFRLNTDGRSFKDMAKSADGLKAAVTASATACDRLRKNVAAFNFANFSRGVSAVSGAVSTLQGTIADLSSAYAAQEQVETKLATVMRERMGASDAEIQSIKDLASAQQSLGVIGDEVQLAGAQQVATFLTEKGSIETLLPAMNDLIAQQRGLTATQQDAQQIGNMLGKVMQGQVSALTRVGITFSGAQAQVLRYGTESERAAMLADVITQNVGHMNAELAKTDSGRQRQLSNTLGDIKEKLGALAAQVNPFVSIAAGVTTAAAAVVQLTGAVRAMNIAFLGNPVGLVCAAVAALAVALKLAYDHSETFREACNAVWSELNALWSQLVGAVTPSFQALLAQLKDVAAAIRPLYEAVASLLGPALKWLGEKIVQGVIIFLKNLASALTYVGKVITKVYNGIASLLGLKSAPVNVVVEEEHVVTTKTKSEGTPVTPEAPARTTKSSPVKSNAPIYREDAATLAEVTENVSYFQARLQEATIEEAAAINASIALWQEKADAIRSAGEVVETEVVPAFDEQAATLAGIQQNIGILQARLQEATIEEAAGLNQAIALWQEKADAIRQAGLATEDYTAATGGASPSGVRLTDAWRDTEGIAGGIERITESVERDGNAWDKVSGMVNGCIGVFQSVTSIIGMVRTLFAGAASAATAQAAAENAAATASAALTTTETTQAAAAALGIVANKALTASYMELASAMYYAAHAYIPFAGFGIATGFVTASVAAVQAVAATPFANGGVVSGPTLAYVGEYAGASANPEVIAPLDKLRSLIGGTGGRVDFRIRGNNLVGVLANTTRTGSRAGRRTNITI